MENIDQGKRKSGSISNLLDGYMSKFEKVETPPTLLDAPDELYLMKLGRCKWCGNKLKLIRNGKLYICSSVKHKPVFKMSVGVYNSLTNS
jgi:hypothetical protein